MSAKQPILYGGRLSYFTGKARSYLNYRQVAFEEKLATPEIYKTIIIPAVGYPMIPVVVFPDGQVIQDTTELIDHFEQDAGALSVIPTTARQHFVSAMMELYGDEWLVIPAMHYRWNFDEQNLAFITSEFALTMPQSLSAEEAAQMFLHSSGRMRKAAVVFGVTPESQPLIEAAFHEWLDLFEAHLVDHPYLLGNRPTIGDYGLIAAMWAHLFRDPAPTMVIKRRAPRVGRWVERMSSVEPRIEHSDRKWRVARKISVNFR